MFNLYLTIIINQCLLFFIIPVVHFILITNLIIKQRICLILSDIK